MNKLKILLLLLLFSLFSGFLLKSEKSEDKITILLDSLESLQIDTSIYQYKFISKEKNIIHDSTQTLYSLYRRMVDLKRRKDTVLSIVHIGDSHIQAGFLSGRMMRLLQNDFGNAGRGLIVPLRLAKTNEPLDYKITSSVAWNGNRLIQRNAQNISGIGGVVIEANSDKIDFTISLSNTSAQDYAFDQITIFSDPNAPLLYPDSASIENCTIEKTSPFAYELKLNALTDSVSLKAKAMTAEASNKFYGFLLRNGNPGVLYHSIGVNGAHYLDYQKGLVFEQTKALNPDLIILSLGTNEAFGRNLNYSEFKRQVEVTVAKLKSENPQAKLLITIPPQCYEKRRVNKKLVYEPNQKIKTVRKVLVDFANEQGIAWWDLYEVTGGNGSAKQWYVNKLMSKDRIHFTEEGYKLQADILYNAFQKSYNGYLNAQN
ncbi:MAG: GDSL-type esterase/lipase family protein [Bacteroidales bacterium]